MEKKKTQKKENAWLIHVAKFRKEHPEFKGLSATTEARKTYNQPQTQKVSEAVMPAQVKPETQSAPALIPSESKTQNPNLPALPNYPPKPKTEEEKKAEWEKKLGGQHEIISKSEYQKIKEQSNKARVQLPFWKVFAVVCLILLFGVIFLAYNGKFQTIIGDTSNNFNATISSPTTNNNQYTIPVNSTTANYNNFTIINEIKIYTNST